MNKFQGKDLQRSEEIQDIIDRMPTGWTCHVTFIIVLFIMVVLVLGCLIKYPDTVVGEITITSETAVRLLAAGSGRLHLLRKDRDRVTAGEAVAYIDDGAVLSDIMILDSLLSVSDEELTEDLPALLMGGLASVYDAWLAARQSLNLLKSTEIYSIMRRNLDEQLRISQYMAESQEHQISLEQANLQTALSRIEKDSLLNVEGAISDEEMERKRSSQLSLEMQLFGQRSSLLSTQSGIIQNRIERARVEVNESEELRRAMDNVKIRENELRSALRQWKERNLLTASISGQLEFLGFWREHEFVQAGQTLFSILPSQGRVYGEAHVSTAGFGKVEVGQRANVKLMNYPYDEYGYVSGRVERVSHLTQVVQSSQGAVETYLVIISFPKDFVTNFGLKLNLGYESRGTVEIITRPKRLIERLFDNLKSKKEK